MIENNKLLEMTLSEILSLNQDYKMKVIQLLINQIAEDEVYNAVSHFETKKEQEEYIKYIKEDQKVKLHKTCTKMLQNIRYIYNIIKLYF